MHPPVTPHLSLCGEADGVLEDFSTDPRKAVLDHFPKHKEHLYDPG